MRRIRVEDARRRQRLKRGGAKRCQEPFVPSTRRAALRQKVPDTFLPADEVLVFDRDPVKLIAVDEALRKLEQRDPCKAEVVLLRFFAGLSVEETAAALGISPRMVDKEWAFARAWLARELSKGDTTVK
jgi:DNA-directed RNA polymerase specialized sigma24 family protein